MAQQRIQARDVAVIGGGVSGVSAAIHLKEQGIRVKLFERSGTFGGLWTYDDKVSLDVAYPPASPITNEYEQSPLEHDEHRKGSHSDTAIEKREGHDLYLLHAPPGPAYQSLKNNISMVEMSLQCLPWENDEEFVSHTRIADYIRQSAAKYHLDDDVRFNTRVDNVFKRDSSWIVESTHLSPDDPHVFTQHSESFDALVIATGHYHTPSMPYIPGLSAWKSQHPSLILHSKQYRSPNSYKDKTVLLLGAGVSSLDIAHDISPHAHCIIQISRGGARDLPSALLPANTARISSPVTLFEPLCHDSGTPPSILDGSILLANGERICGIDAVILCTGYVVDYPFLPFDITDGTVTRDLHMDIFHIPDPTLAFVGVPYHVATFSLFEFQAIAIAAVFAGKALLPSREEMERTWQAREGKGRAFHALGAQGAEMAYVERLRELVGREKMVGHTQRGKEAYARRFEMTKTLLGGVRDEMVERAAREGVQMCT